MGSSRERLGHSHILPFASTRSQCINQMKEVKEQCEERIEEVTRRRNEAVVSRDAGDRHSQRQQVIWVCSDGVSGSCTFSPQHFVLTCVSVLPMGVVLCDTMEQILVPGYPDLTVDAGRRARASLYRVEEANAIWLFEAAEVEM